MEPRAEILILKPQGMVAKFPEPEVLGLDESQGHRGENRPVAASLSLALSQG